MTTATITVESKLEAAQASPLLLAYALLDRLMELSPTQPALTLPNQVCGILVAMLKEVRS
jgi:hypothetical protein